MRRDEGEVLAGLPDPGLLSPEPPAEALPSRARLTIAAASFLATTVSLAAFPWLLGRDTASFVRGMKGLLALAILSLLLGLLAMRPVFRDPRRDRWMRMPLLVAAAFYLAGWAGVPLGPLAAFLAPVILAYPFLLMSWALSGVLQTVEWMAVLVTGVLVLTILSIPSAVAPWLAGFHAPAHVPAAVGLLSLMRRQWVPHRRPVPRFAARS